MLTDHSSSQCTPVMLSSKESNSLEQHAGSPSQYTLSHFTDISDIVVFQNTVQKDIVKHLLGLPVDLTVFVGRERFQCHRALLTSMSGYFREKLSGSWAEILNGTCNKNVEDRAIPIFTLQEENVTSRSFRLFLSMLYMDDIESIERAVSADTVLDMLNLALFLKVDLLERFCVKFLESFIASPASSSLSNLRSKIWFLAVVRGVKSLERTMTNKAALEPDVLKDILEQEGIVDISGDKLMLLIRSVIVHDQRTMSSLLTAMFHWTIQDVIGRKAKLKEMLDHVIFQLVCDNTLAKITEDVRFLLPSLDIIKDYLDYEMKVRKSGVRDKSRKECPENDKKLKWEKCIIVPQGYPCTCNCICDDSSNFSDDGFTPVFISLAPTFASGDKEARLIQAISEDDLVEMDKAKTHLMVSMLETFSRERTRLVKSFPIGMWHTSACVWQNDLYISGGAKSPRAFAVYRPRTSSWERLPHLPLDCERHSMAACNDKVYIIGAPLSCCHQACCQTAWCQNLSVWAYSIKDKSWSRFCSEDGSDDKGSKPANLKNLPIRKQTTGQQPLSASKQPANSDKHNENEVSSPSLRKSETEYTSADSPTDASKSACAVHSSNSCPDHSVDFVYPSVSTVCFEFPDKVVASQERCLFSQPSSSTKPHHRSGHIEVTKTADNGIAISTNIVNLFLNSVKCVERRKVREHVAGNASVSSLLGLLSNATKLIMSASDLVSSLSGSPRKDREDVFSQKSETSLYYTARNSPSPAFKAVEMTSSTSVTGNNTSTPLKEAVPVTPPAPSHIACKQIPEIRQSSVIGAARTASNPTPKPATNTTDPLHRHNAPAANKNCAEDLSFRCTAQRYVPILPPCRVKQVFDRMHQANTLSSSFRNALVPQPSPGYQVTVQESGESLKPPPYSKHQRDPHSPPSYRRVVSAPLGVPGLTPPPSYESALASPPLQRRGRGYNSPRGQYSPLVSSPLTRSTESSTGPSPMANSPKPSPNQKSKGTVLPPPIQAKSTRQVSKPQAPPQTNTVPKASPQTNTVHHTKGSNACSSVPSFWNSHHAARHATALHWPPVLDRLERLDCVHPMQARTAVVDNRFILVFCPPDDETYEHYANQAATFGLRSMVKSLDTVTGRIVKLGVVPFFPVAVPIVEDDNSAVVIAFRGDVTFWRMTVDVKRLKEESERKKPAGEDEKRAETETLLKTEPLSSETLGIQWGHLGSFLDKFVMVTKLLHHPKFMYSDLHPACLQTMFLPNAI